MTRGHQREAAREKAAAKAGKGKKAGDSESNKGLTPQQRSERDAAALAAKKARKAEAANSSAEAKAKQEEAEKRKAAKRVKDKAGKLAKQNPLLAKQMGKQP
eukprot:TRINITY_DN876_c0_g1_i2.p3 TRINITY_DN876_c0_g1~~TRINITY_DN876_c0_g1_i2.p3  ORF type:complete len:102 (-),score=43.94 TRINITY_DN876_c0_g1_i2:505-810(-)